MTEDEQLSLIKQATDGDREALERLLLAQCTHLSQHIAPRIPAPAQSTVSVEDILQQTLLQAFKNIQRFQPTTARSFRIWLRTIAENELKNSLAALRTTRRGGVAGPVGQVIAEASWLTLLDAISGSQPSPSERAAGREAVHAIHVAVAGLPSDQHRAVVLNFLEGKSLDRAAEEMGCTKPALRGLLRRAKTNLRLALGRSSRWLSKVG